MLAAAKKHFIVEKLAGAATDVGAISAPRSPIRSRTSRRSSSVFAGEADAWKLTLSPDVSPIAEGVAVDRALQKLRSDRASSTS